jgi:uncharacterized protein YcbK (DUF882 family)
MLMMVSGDTPISTNKFRRSRNVIRASNCSSCVAWDWRTDIATTIVPYSVGVVSEGMIADR